MYIIIRTYWKFAITTAEDNSELKIWDCGSWNCLQKIIFNPSGGRFIAEMDRTSSYLVLSCLDSRTCYVLEIIYASRKEQMKIAVNENSIVDADDGDNDYISANIGLRGDATRSSSTGSSNNSANGSNSSCGTNSNRISSSNTGSTQSTNELMLEVSDLDNIPVYIKSISAFSLSSGILAFTIVDAALRRYKNPNGNYICEEIDDYDEDTSNSIYCVILHMYVVQSKSLQECHILYQTKTPNKGSKASIIETENNSTQVKNKIEQNICSKVNEDKGVESNTGKYDITKCNVTPILTEQSHAESNLMLETSENVSNDNAIILNKQQKLMSPFLNVSNKEKLETDDENAQEIKTEFVPPSTFPPSPPSSASPSNNQSSLSISTSQPSSSSSLTATKTYNALHVSSINLMTPDAFTSSNNSGKSTNCVHIENKKSFPYKIIK